MEISSLIKSIRNSSKKTQEEFAHSINVSRGTISQIESGRANPTMEILEKIINTYSLDANIFFKNDIPKLVPNNIPNVNINDNEGVNFEKSDLDLLGNIFYYPSIDELKKYNELSETGVKRLFKELYSVISTRIDCINSLVDISKTLKVDDKKNIFNKIDKAEYIAKYLEEYNPESEGCAFKSKKLYNSVQIYALNEAKEVLEEIIIIDMVGYLKRCCEYNVKFGIIKF